jgi:hypothetical protein
VASATRRQGPGARASDLAGVVGTAALGCPADQLYRSAPSAVQRTIRGVPLDKSEVSVKANFSWAVPEYRRVRQRG